VEGNGEQAHHMMCEKEKRTSYSLPFLARCNTFSRDHSLVEFPQMMYSQEMTIRFAKGINN
jgi:hypothetical protein